MSEEEVKVLLKRNLELAEDTNRMLHGMRRRAFLGTLFNLFFWIVFVIVPAVAFYIYAAPYFDQVQNMITSTQQLQADLKGKDTSSLLQNLYEQYMQSKSK